MRDRLANIWHLGVKEIYSLRFDLVLIGLIIYALTYAVYSPAENTPEGVTNASIAIVDEDRSALSRRIRAAFLMPQFQTPAMLSIPEVDPAMDAGRYTFVVHIPPALEADLLRGRTPTVQVLADATAMTQAGIGISYIQQIISQEVNAFLHLPDAVTEEPIALTTRVRFNPNLDSPPFLAVVQLANNITMLALFLAGAATIREREHGTLEHLVAMPLRPFEIMLAKVWANSAVILIGSALSLEFLVRRLIGASIAGSVPLFTAGVVLYLFAVAALGILLATVSRTMPQFGLLAVPVYITMALLSGGQTPLESMPRTIRLLMYLSPSTHFMTLTQAILYRGAGFSVVWPEFGAISALGAVCFGAALVRFRRALVL